MPRRLFLGAVALVAAALGDACVEMLANLGAFGAGYRDDDQRGVVPAVACALVLLFLVVVARGIALWRGDGESAGWVERAATSFAERGPLTDLPVTFALQVLALFGIESAERFARCGCPIAGAHWLGGPPLLALALHLSFAIACTVALGALMRGVVATLASIVRRVRSFAFIVRVASPPRPFRCRRPTVPARRLSAPHVRETGGRAPPVTTAFA